jgi:CBS domain-containing protein
MNAISATGRRNVCQLRADELMQPNPVSVREDERLSTAAQFLIDRHFTAAPVIDDAGRPVGVVSLTDLAKFDAGKRTPRLPEDDYYDRTVLTLADMKKWEGFDFSQEATVKEAMTPVVLAVRPYELAAEVIKLMLERKVHRIFVRDDTGTIIGIITTFDILQYLTA